MPSKSGTAAVPVFHKKRADGLKHCRMACVEVMSPRQPCRGIDGQQHNTVFGVSLDTFLCNQTQLVDWVRVDNPEHKDEGEGCKSRILQDLRLRNMGIECKITSTNTVIRSAFLKDPTIKITTHTRRPSHPPMT